MNDESDERRGYGPALVVISYQRWKAPWIETGTVIWSPWSSNSWCIAVHTFIPMDLLIIPYTSTHKAPKAVLSDSEFRSLTEHRPQSAAVLKTSPDLHLSFR